MIAQRWDEAEGGFFEKHLDGGRVDNFGAIISFGEKADRVDALVLAAGIPDVEIGNDCCGIQRRAIGEGHTVLEMEGEFRCIVILLPAFCEPGTDLAFGIDIKKLVGDMSPDMSLEAGDGAVIGDPGIAERVNQEGYVTTILRCFCGLNRSEARCRDQKSRCNRSRCRDQQASPGEVEKRRSFGHGVILMFLGVGCVFDVLRARMLVRDKRKLRASNRCRCGSAPSGRLCRCKFWNGLLLRRCQAALFGSFEQEARSALHIPFMTRSSVFRQEDHDPQPISAAPRRKTGYSFSIELVD